jgi:parallel beta-helix repeat protein
VIQGWEIDTSTTDGIILQGTTAHAVVRDMTIVGPGVMRFAGITLGGASNVTLDSVNVTRYGAGIVISGGSNLTIRRSVIASNSGYGIDVENSHAVRLEDNNALGNRWGVFVASTAGAVVANNRFTRHYVSIDIVGSPDVQVSGNLIRDEPWGSNAGISVEQSDGAAVTGNDISSVAGVGVHIELSSGVKFTGNNVTFSGMGAQLLQATATITHNRFSFDANGSTDDLANPWDAGYPTGGNAWSDYLGIDHCRGPAQDDCSAPDGIGDTPYASSPSVRDRYPLVLPNRPFKAQISASASDVLVGRAIVFTASARDPDGTVNGYRWDFGDGVSGSDAVVTHLYEAAGTYSVRLDLTDDRGVSANTTQSVQVWSVPTFMTVEHASGFRLPIPTDWDVRKDSNVSGNTVPILALGPTVNGFRTNLIVATSSDPTAREDDAYLRSGMNETLLALQRSGQVVVVTDGPTLFTVSGHRAVAFGLGRPSLGIFQRVVLVVSAAHGRDWVLVLSVTGSAYGQTNATFDAIVSGFSITAIPPIVLVGLVGGIVAAAVTVVVIMVVRRRKRVAPPMPGSIPSGVPSTPPSATISAPYPAQPGMTAPMTMSSQPFTPREVRFCPKCGAAASGNNFCTNCGFPLRR